jgi:hypothetical protein
MTKIGLRPIQMLFVIPMLIGFLPSSALSQGFTYTYSGHSVPISPPQIRSGVVTISISLTFPLPSNISQGAFSFSAWTISNGLTTISSSDPQSSFSATLSTDASGAIVSWNIGGFNSTGLRIDSCYIPFGCSYDSTMQRTVDGNSFVFSGMSSTPGTWSRSSSGTPTPSLSRTGTLSHIAAGGGWTTVITLINTSPAAVPVIVALHNDDGSALTLPVTTTQQGATQTSTTPTVNASLSPNSTLLISTGSQNGSLVVGWADVLSQVPVGGFAIFRQTPQTGSPSEGTVPLQNQFPSTMTLAYDNAGGFLMGVALANLSTAFTTITATIWDDNGNQLGVQDIVIAGNGHTSFVLPNQLSATTARRGIVQFRSSAGGISGVGIRFSPFGTFTSVPAIQSQ